MKNTLSGVYGIRKYYDWPPKKTLHVCKTIHSRVWAFQNSFTQAVFVANPHIHRLIIVGMRWRRGARGAKFCCVIQSVPSICRQIRCFYPKRCRVKYFTMFFFEIKENDKFAIKLLISRTFGGIMPSNFKPNRMTSSCHLHADGFCKNSFTVLCRARGTVRFSKSDNLRWRTHKLHVSLYGLCVKVCRRTATKGITDRYNLVFTSRQHSSTSA